MKIYLTDTGDYSVGIPNNAVYIEWNTGYPDASKQFREEERAVFKRMFQEYFDPCGEVDCVFGDECSECGEVVGEELDCLSCVKRRVVDGL